MQHEVERYASSTRWFHWVHASMFLVLGLTGLFLFLPWLGDAAIGGVSRLFHRIAAIIFVVAPLVFLLMNWGRSWAFVKEAFVWSKDDVEWLKAAPSYYFGGDPSKMPPQGHSNSGQKLFWLFSLVGAVIFVVTGIIMWFLKGIVPAGLFQGMIILHDIAFIAVGCFFMVHFALSVLHPKMTESMRSMVGGKVSAEYAKSHHGKWYSEVTKGKG
ncbi:formate dehydrogenase subunit gamma [Chloroflexota bacterium]